MGIDKCLDDDSPIILIDGSVYQYGKSPEYIPWTDEKWDPPQWIVEHHSYAKWHFCFRTEEALLDYIDALPESAHPPFEPNLAPYLAYEERDGLSCRVITDPEGWDAELRRHKREVREWRHALAERKRAERAKLRPIPPEQAYVANCRAAIDAILNRHLKPHEDWQNPEIERQIGLVLRYELKKYREATGSDREPPCQDTQDDEIPF